MQVFDVEEIILNASHLDERALGVGDELVHMRSKKECHHFLNELCDCMDESNRPKICHLLGAIFVGSESSVFGIKPLEVVDM